MESIYIIKAGPYHKIGKAVSPKDRAKELQTGNAYEFEIVYSTEVPDALVVEKENITGILDQ